MSSHVPRSVPHDVSLALFRAVQEAVNLPKRSGARNAHHAHRNDGHGSSRHP